MDQDSQGVQEAQTEQRAHRAQKAQNQSLFVVSRSRCVIKLFLSLFPVLKWVKKEMKLLSRQKIRKF